MLSDEHLGALARKIFRDWRCVAHFALRAFNFRVVQRIFLQAPRVPATGRPARSIGIALLCLGVCAGLLGRMVQVGFDRGMDGQMYEVVEDAAHAMAVAISDMRFGLHRGYVGYTAIYNVLQFGGFTSHPLIIKDMPKPRRLTTLKEARDYVDEAMRLGRPAPWREVWHRLKSVMSEEDAIEAAGDLRELLAEEYLLLPSTNG